MAILRKMNRHIFSKAQYDKSLMLTGLQLKQDIQTEIRKEKFVDTGELAKSVFVKKNMLWVVVGSDRPQAYVAEYGRKPWKFPNMNGLVGWSIRKLGLKGKKTWSYDSQPAETKGVIYLVARKIAKKGIRERKIFSRAYNPLKLQTIFINTLRQWII